MRPKIKITNEMIDLYIEATDRELEDPDMNYDTDDTVKHLVVRAGLEAAINGERRKGDRRTSKEGAKCTLCPNVPGCCDGKSQGAPETYLRCGICGVAGDENLRSFGCTRPGGVHVAGMVDPKTGNHRD